MKHPWLKMAALMVLVMLSFMTACGASEEKQAAHQEETPTIQLRISWSGSQVRHDATLKALEAYTQLHPHVRFEPEYMGFDTYWTKMATLSAARNLPDILQIDTGNLQEYVNRDQLLDLSGDIDLSNVEEKQVKTGKIDGKQYAIPIGANAIAFHYNKVMFERLGIKVPEQGFTWDQMIQLAREVKPKLEKGTYLLQDLSISVGGVGSNQYEIFQVAQGKGLLHTSEGEFNMDRETYLAFNHLFSQLRTEGVVPPAEVSISNKDYDPKLDNLLNGTILVQRGYAASLGAIDGIKPGEFGLMVVPSAKQSGSYLLTAQFFAVNKFSPHAEEAKRFINWFINDIEAGKILGLSRGPQVSKKVSAALQSSYSEVEKQQVELVEKTAPIASELYSRPKGYSRFIREYNNISQQIGFGKLTPEQGYDELVKKWDEIIGSSVEDVKGEGAVLWD